MMKAGVVSTVISLIVFIYACHQKPVAQDAIIKKQKTDSTVFYPITNFFKQQIQAVDSTPYYIYKITLTNGKKDSLKIDINQFNSLAQIFIAENISDSSVKRNYKESIFDDSSTKSLTLNYTSSDSTLFIQSADVLLNEGDQRVKHIFMSAYKKTIDSSITYQMGWKTDRNFYINRNIFANGKEIIEETTIVWDNRE